MEAVLIPGDGIGREIAASVVRVSEALETGIVWKPYQAGAAYYEKTGALFEEGMLEAIQSTGTALKGPTATPIGTGFRSINVQLRQMFHTYANLRPVHSIPGVKTRFDNVDLVIVRENSEDLYKGLEYRVDENTAHGIKLITRPASERIVRFAFEYARKYGRHKVTAVHKANIMKETDGLFLEAAKTVAGEYPDIRFDSVIIDALCMKLVTDPTQFDVLVAPNLYGDIISDLCAGLVGGLGFAPSANIGKDTVIYEAVHGSAPDIAGKGIANPTALLMAFEMLLRDHGMKEKADCLQTALKKALADTQAATPDVGGTGTTSAFTDAVIDGILENK
ncbi:MAG: isocitrate/isopropylmalate dehydrogenase family protein [Galactobacillus timonensis]|uniref:isocitrate/isopropylmalate dehydrogenase family protein n=1 Tax=Galactobacillus timonensis TaxID=2041840 RepID=UPI00240906B2|nr:isocitrate/isopropylmalate dehydrogenase family protein [Galactobacillus timonensis]MDD6599365.1 isocitrate/isopropylmalate dehydrogenase family protein [Galactobacillus timonensis]MDY6282317.1 isocitrate/isopropylmalate dehydrogenase family protein [Erysipelotrichaceae bacterium]